MSVGSCIVQWRPAGFVDIGASLDQALALSQQTVQRGQLKIPVISNLPFGHVTTKVLLPVGARAQLLVEGRDAMLYWG